jgi:FMN phosphatase YigB (HAD superfamily)
MSCADKKTSDIKLRIFDFDGTIYPNPDILNDHVYRQLFKSLRCKRVKGLTLNQVKELGLISYKANGHSAVGLAESFNMIMHELYDDYHRRLNPNIITTTKKDHERMRSFCNYALSIGENVRNCILTHSTVDWTFPALALLNNNKGVRQLSKVFSSKAGNIFTAEDYRFADSSGNITQYLKSGSFIPFLTVCAEMDTDPRECAMVEDSLSNLKIAKMLGMQTIFTHHGKPIDTLPDYVDYQIDDIGDMSSIPLAHDVSADEGFNDFIDRLMDKARETLAKDSPRRVVDCDQFPAPRSL